MKEDAVSAIFKYNEIKLTQGKKNKQKENNSGTK